MPGPEYSSQGCTDFLVIVAKVLNLSCSKAIDTVLKGPKTCSRTSIQYKLVVRIFQWFSYLHTIICSKAVGTLVA